MSNQAVAFSDVQLGVLRIWRASHPFGLDIRIIRNFGSCSKAEVFHRDQTAASWQLDVGRSGTVMLTGALGVWAMGSIEAALEKILDFERQRRDPSKIASARSDNDVQTGFDMTVRLLEPMTPRI